MARTLSEDFIGTCQWCFGEYKVNARRKVVLHGYQRPGYGYTMGQCSGYNHSPFEDEHALTDQRIELLRAKVVKNQKNIAKIDAGKVDKLRNPHFMPEGDPKRDSPMYSNYHPKVEYFTPDHREFAYRLRNLRANIESEIRFDEGIIAFLVEQVANWTKRPIVGLDSPATGRERYVRDAYDPDKAKAAEVHAAAKAERAAKPGKITIYVYAKISGPYEGDHAERIAQIEANEKKDTALKNNLKAWAVEHFPGKIWSGKEYFSGYNVKRLLGADTDVSGEWACAVVKVEWHYLDKVLEMFPEGPFVRYRDNSPKDRRIWVSHDEFPADLI